MNIEELTQEMHKLVQSKGWNAENSPRKQTARNLAASLSIESAEVLEHFQWRNNPRDLSALAEELADVSLYLLQLASVCKIDLEQAILDKINANYKRSWDDDVPS